MKWQRLALEYGVPDMLPSLYSPKKRTVGASGPSDLSKEVSLPSCCSAMRLTASLPGRRLQYAARVPLGSVK